ncbi:hypothetical protein NGA_2070400, partial [Nannochloropsis gaditana CCMP526]|uniref:uncharacterized protein n=1 Tax=Nannochloropsis gaditana (strain CCMP526) TaxID=1093141 RepID=UPI00029F6CDD
ACLRVDHILHSSKLLLKEMPLHPLCRREKKASHPSVSPRHRQDLEPDLVLPPAFP